MLGFFDLMLAWSYPGLSWLIQVDLVCKFKMAPPAGLEAVEWIEKLTAKLVDAA